MKENSDASNPLDQAKTPEQHRAIFRRHGILWWWRTKNDWYNREIREWSKKHDNSDSLDSLEGLPLKRRRLSIWPLGALFPYRYERSAFLYEMKARITGKFEFYEFDKPWIDLTEGQMDELATRWPMTKSGPRDKEMHRPIYNMMRPGTHPLPGWTNYVNISWNLHYNDTTLIRAFKSILRQERTRSGQHLKVNQGSRRRSLSWRPIELIDQKQFDGKRFNQGGRSQVSKAIRAAKRVFNSTTN